ncbi:hypothetical protein F383_05831 [Gossypium arboreum]|uniref:Uncharacterized protein n=1 Tax=Gossypium arboreum TaxID=29729 RepID=A0A0B0PPE7_GOSAR|nr:hypothetical protein F383_05831 [Gossypium arboreum]
MGHPQQAYCLLRYPHKQVYIPHFRPIRP